MLKKVLSNKLYVLNNFDKQLYINFEDENIHWDKKKKQFVSNVPNYIVIYNNKELLTNLEIKNLEFGTYQEGLLVDKSDFENISFFELLSYLKYLLNSFKLMNYCNKLETFNKNSVKDKICVERKRK